MRTPIKHVRLIKGQPCRAAELSNSDDTFLEPHRHEYWELVWCVDDLGSQSIDFVDYDNKVGRIFTIAPGQVHRSELVGENARLLVFTPGFVKTNHRNTQLVDTVFAMHQSRPPYLDCNEEGNRYLLPIFTMIKEECERENSDWDLVESLVNSFLRYILRFATQSSLKGEVRDSRVNKVVDLIEQHYTTHKQCDFYAYALSITNKRINEIVKADKGKTVTQLIHDRIILEANRELIFSTKTIKTIAFELGFEDPAYFSRFYRGQMNESPAEFRARCADSAT
ncbi:AraC family transcriptional regulator, transcriptional activator of pobA [Vibrio crassostreae]|uniref:helix-turn-helix domain-containing protein n=1 Tax=Vibrio crassostreae TaxID=246167 RepID=UPI001052E24B|nr:helix-turn-helix domain-containing protein [Vibrio crassostreae]TCN83713.1 AraC family transcriptional regulator [Vibrio crassostreae]CAK2460040.1 AraC family transcriptional regulator, transcriptional activator of pobA [Vibrio crassostreae]CAK2464467.1 AraC family transcriptional regulator, transcriptional activator of pobA [Vibrio crassostreae]CAK2838983.1 AraC family transcriptional regulator, transcriptional activator of pobA [Vibrio crassostreae]CAK3332597.1 AraC family transcriptional